MNLETRIGAMLFALVCAFSANAATYSVTGIFEEPMIGINTEFHGFFDWNPNTLTVSNLTGTMNEAMYAGPWTSVPGHDYVNFGPYGSVGRARDLWPNQNTFWGQLNYFSVNGLYMLTLDKNIIQSDNGVVHTATVFKENTSDVYLYGGYDQSVAASNNFLKYGAIAPSPYVDGNVSNENAFFTMVFEHDASGNITSVGLQNINQNAALVNQMIYGDCAIGGLLQLGSCMAGTPTGDSAHAGTPYSLEITQVPIPGIAWLFGASLVGLLTNARINRSNHSVLESA
jgi:hypothetical protein